MALRKPVRNLPAIGSRHQCSLVVTTDADGNAIEPISLKDELACRQANLDNGTIFTCEDTVTIAGKEATCGKEWVLHYPTTFAWKVRRTNAAANGEATAEVAQQVAQEPEHSGKKNKR